MMRRGVPAILLALLAAAWLLAEPARKPTDKPAKKTAEKPATKPATQPAGKKPKPKSNLELWLAGEEEKPAEKVDPLKTGVNPFQKRNAFRRDDALPGVVELSDGRQIPGGLYTTREKDWEVHVEKEKRWRRVPPILVLSITAVVIEEKMEPRWRWKAMGVPERVYTGKLYPYRRFRWKFHLIDDSYITGTIKGQPLWIEKPSPQSGRHGPFVLHERFTGRDDTKLKDHPYVKRVIVSRRMMDKVVAHHAKEIKGKQEEKTRAGTGR